MSNTSNFDFCVQISIDVVREIFHLAFKNEDLFPHNVGPFDRQIGGLDARVSVVVLDDESRPADLSFEDGAHMRFRVPNDITVELPDAPDPALSRLTLSSTASFPGRLHTWDDHAGEPVLGIVFDDVDAADVVVEDLTGVPTIDAEEFANAIHSRYPTVPHRHTLPVNGGSAELLLYDGTLDVSLVPPHPTGQPITAALEGHPSGEHLKVVVPIHVDVPTGFGFDYESFGTITFWRPVTRTDTTVSVDMSAEPADGALVTTVALDTASPAREPVITQLTPLARSAVNAFGTLSAPAHSPAAAAAAIAEEMAAYLRPLSFGLFTPRSSEPGVVLTSPVGFLLVASGTLAVLITRRTGGPADDVAPDDFRGSRDVALAVGRPFVIERSDAVIQDRFPGVNGGGGFLFERDEGTATLRTVHAEPADDGAHGHSPGHLWITGEAEVHIDCWPDPDVTFSGPVFIDATPEHDEAEGCWLRLQPEAGEFDVGQSCCDVLLDILIPVVGWIVLVVVESLIDEVGGQIAEETATAETQMLEPLPTLVIGVAELECCLEDITVSHQGFVFPGALAVRRDGRSFSDVHDAGRAPRPDGP